MTRYIKHNTTKPILLSLKEAGQILGVSYKTVAREVEAGRLPARLMPGRKNGMKVYRKDLDTYVAEWMPVINDRSKVN